MNSFLSAVRNSSNDERAFNGPYMCLLCHLFSIDGPFEIILQFPKDNAAVFTVELNNHPVMFINIQGPASFRKHQDTDREMQERFRDLRLRVVTPTLTGISAFGTRLSFYSYDKATNSLCSPAIAADPNITTDVVPQDRWGFDILDATDAACFRGVVNQVKEMCAQLVET
ncbi:uncharacterized protein BT62DRAFT_928799 [Guyanagaster necrorhizus]|uniref:Uncharacterized protein n=1 Tax=Guyanagaster necrorhizus TaxID=856835 RepID=A0A9P7W0X1_9AGAR|nr:uncharacterized protein BT62DRAFT_928799 [Guyanagaster necrorhizus MCA 3950]KAG7450015.1 hypothetical protein BT62DRAFT_928799 [Guyanagaster necrorhizus MCA 3950]